MLLPPPDGSSVTFLYLKCVVFLKYQKTIKTIQNRIKSIQKNIEKLKVGSIFRFFNMSRIHWEKEDRVELEKSFAENPHPDAIERQLLADKLRVPVEKIQNFFKNQRVRLRRSGVSIKRVFPEDSRNRASKRTRKKIAQATPEASPELVKKEQRSPVVKLERDDDPDYRPDETVETAVSSEVAESIIVIADSRQNSETTLDKTPINSENSSPINHSVNSIQSLPTVTPVTPFQVPNFQPTPFTSSTPIIPTYLPVQSPYLTAVQTCFDSTAIQYFPINENSTKLTDPVEHEKNLDQILENNLNHLNESKDTGIEDGGFEILSEPEPEIEIKPLPNWFPFSVLYPNQPLFSNPSSYNLTYQGYYPSICQTYPYTQF